MTGWLSSFRAAHASLQGEAEAAFVMQHAGDGLCRIEPTDLPTDGVLIWRDIARLLKADPTRPIAARNIPAINSWPRERIAIFTSLLLRLADAIEHAENERQQDEIRDSIRHTYL